MLLGRLMGLRRKFTVDGVRYRELSADSLRRALSKKGRGYKDYHVTFPGGASMNIRATSERRFADIMGEDVLDACRAAEPFVKPGMRIAILQSGTGAVGTWAAKLVGAAGAVVALDRDKQSIRYARHRYVLPNVAFEVGGVEALAGETAGAFEVAIATDVLREAEAAAAIAELWRTLAGGGVLVLAAPHGGEPEGAAELRGSPGAGPAGGGDAGGRALDELAAAIDRGLAQGPRPEQVSIFRRGGSALAVVRHQAE